jgi:hypothetical protein
VAKGDTGPGGHVDELGNQDAGSGGDLAGATPPPGEREEDDRSPQGSPERR